MRPPRTALPPGESNDTNENLSALTTVVRTARESRRDYNQRTDRRFPESAASSGAQTTGIENTAVLQLTVLSLHDCHEPVMATLRTICILLWLPYGIGQAIIFSCSGFYLLSSLFPRLIPATAHWMSTIIRHMVWP